MRIMSLFRQGSQFLLVGILQLLLDWAVFVAMTALGMAVIPANLTGRTSGALLGFWLNGKVTFAHHGEARLGWPRFTRFLLVWLALTAISSWAVALVAHNAGLGPSWIAKPLVEGILALVSFFLMRHVVYR